MTSESKTSLPAVMMLHVIGNFFLTWFLVTYFEPFFVLTGGWPGIIVVGSVLTLLNIFVRPILKLATAPLKLFATILAIILVNGVFTQLTVSIVERMDEEIVQLSIEGGLWGWIVVAVILGVGNWVIKTIARS